MSHAYVWNPKSKVLSIYGKQLTIMEAQDNGLKGREVVDTFYEDPRERYGRFIDGSSGWHMAWEPLEWQDLDPEFRAHLLLLGVS